MVELGDRDVVKKCIEEFRIKAEELVDVKFLQTSKKYQAYRRT